jgi:2-polyprenyl-6-methoxyphenol hydroxylase-like FAD-dependent oxidoreductase
VGVDRVSTRVIIVGSGIGGLCAAIGLRAAGMDVTVYEKRADPRELAFGGGMTLWNNAMRALERLGLAEAVAATGTAIEQAEWRTARGGRLLATWPVAELSRDVGAPTVCVTRLKLQRVLADAYGDDRLRLGVGCVGFREDPSGVTALLTDGSEERADVLIGADGLSSSIRGQLHGLPRPRYSGYGVWFAIADQTTDDAVWREIDGPGARFVYFPVDGGRIYWACIANAEESEVAQAAGAETPGEQNKLLGRFRGWPEPVEQLIASSDERDLFRRPIVDRNPLRRWGSGRVTLLGDAAHPLTINLGQGACQAIEDALILTEALAGDGAPAERLRTYEHRRIRRVTSYTLRARMIGAVYRWRSPLVCRARDVLVERLLPGPVFKQHWKDMRYEF